MKSKLLIISFLFIIKISFAQDSIRVEAVQDTFVAPQFTTAYDDVFMNHREAKWLLKVDWMGLLGQFQENMPKNPPYGIEVERKLGKEISINLGVSTTTDLYSLVEGIKDVTSIKYTLEPRWYLGMRNDILNNKQANNLNGQYVSIKAGFYQNFEHSNRACFGDSLGCAIYLANNLPKYSFSANYGIQKRVFNNWYVNYNVGFSAEVIETKKEELFQNFYQEPRVKWHFAIENNVTLGLAFGGKKRQKLNKCEFYRCFEEENSLWKLDLKNLLGVFKKDETKLGIAISREAKINSSAFSVNTELSGYYKSQNQRIFFDNDRFVPGFSDHFPRGLSASSNGNVTVLNYGGTISFEPRFYFNLKRRIAKGKSANNLSGLYVSTEFKGKLGKFDFKNISVNGSGEESFTEKAFFILPKLGLQKRIFKNGYFDLSVAPNWFGYSEIKGNKGHLGTFNAPVNKFNGLKIDFKLGFAF